jgi:hypothetical protein
MGATGRWSGRFGRCGRRGWPAAAILSAAVLASLLPRPSAAHELGMFQVFGTFQRDGTFRFDVKVDQEHLPGDRQGGPARVTRYGPIQGMGGAAEKQFGAFLCDLADALTLRFDGRPFAPVLALDPQAAADAALTGRVVMRVEGWIPPGAHTFTLTSALPGKPYPLVLNNEGDELSVWKWIDSGATSQPFRLAPAVLPPASAAVARIFALRGAASVLPHGPAALLLVAALFLLARHPLAAAAQLAGLTLAQTAGLVLAASGALTPSPAWTAPLLALAVTLLALAALAPGAEPGARSERSAPSQPGAASATPVVPGRASRRPLAAWLPLLILPVGLLYGLAAAPAVPSAAAPAASMLAGHAPPWLAPAVAAFALGTLAAELAITAAAFALIGLPLGRHPWYRSRVVVPAAALIAVIGLYWSLAGLL